MKESDLYRPLDLPPELDSLDQELLCRLRNAVHNHGVERGETAVSLVMREPYKLSVTVSRNLENRTMMLIGSGGVTKDGSFLFKLIAAAGFEPAIVVWDRRVTIQEVEELIRRAPEIGNRMKEESASGEELKISVEEVFGDRGVVMPVLPGGPSAEEMLREFDHPEELTVIEEMGLKSICRRRDVPSLNHRKNVARALLKEEGISLEEALTWDFGRIIEFREKLETRLRQ